MIAEPFFPPIQLRISIICSDHISMYRKGNDTLDIVLHNTIYRHYFLEFFFPQLHIFPIRHVKTNFVAKMHLLHHSGQNA